MNGLRFAVRESGFTLLEVLVALTVLAVGTALTLSVVSGALGNIRKVQQRTRVIQHAETVMELTLLDENIKEPTTLSGDFEDGTRWSVLVSDHEMPPSVPANSIMQLPQRPLKLLHFYVEVFAPGSAAADFHLQTLKLIPDQQAPAAEEP